METPPGRPDDLPLGAQARADAPPPTRANRDILPMSTGVPTIKWLFGLGVLLLVAAIVLFIVYPRVRAS